MAPSLDKLTKNEGTTESGSAVIYAVRTSGEKFLSSLHCVAKKEKSKRVPKLGGREPDVLTADPLRGSSHVGSTKAIEN